MRGSGVVDATSGQKTDVDFGVKSEHHLLD